jgi:hypothetical protein
MCSVTKHMYPHITKQSEHRLIIRNHKDILRGRKIETSGVPDWLSVTVTVTLTDVRVLSVTDLGSRGLSSLPTIMLQLCSSLSDLPVAKLPTAAVEEGFVHHKGTTDTQRDNAR